MITSRAKIRSYNPKEGPITKKTRGHKKKDDKTVLPFMTGTLFGKILECPLVAVFQFPGK